MFYTKHGDDTPILQILTEQCDYPNPKFGRKTYPTGVCKPALLNLLTNLFRTGRKVGKM